MEIRSILGHVAIMVFNDSVTQMNGIKKEREREILVSPSTINALPQQRTAFTLAVLLPSCLATLAVSPKCPVPPSPLLRPHGSQTPPNEGVQSGSSKSHRGPHCASRRRNVAHLPRPGSHDVSALFPLWFVFCFAPNRTTHPSSFNKRFEAASVWMR